MHFLFLIGIYVLSFSFIEAGGENTHHCSFEKSCRCFELQTLVECDHAKLENMPHFPGSVITVDISHNFIDKIKNGQFANNTRMERLDMSFNRLATITKDSFIGLFNLSTLNLNNNNVSSLDSDVFGHLRSLTKLDVKNTRIYVLSLSSMDMPPLSVLKADLLLDTSNVSLPEYLKSVKHFDLSGESGKCRMKTITTALFRSLTSVEYLDISNCQINTVYKGSFRHMASLSVLNLSKNMCLKFAGLTNISQDLPYTSIKIVKANQVHKPFDLNTFLSIDIFSPLNRTNVTEIYIDSNRIQLIQTGALYYLPPTLRVMQLSDNEFSYGDYLFEIRSLPVELINASNLFQAHAPFAKSEICDRVYDEKPSTINEKTEYKTTDSTYPHSNYYDLQTFTYYLPKNLKRLIYRNCRLRYTIPHLKVSDNIVESLDGGNNLFFAWIGPLEVFRHAKYLDLSYNLCSNVSKEFFKSGPNLEVLNIQGNLLGFIFPDDKNGEILKPVPKLREINLAENRIPHLPDLFFQAQRHMERLNLSGNILDNLDFRLNHMTKLSFLDLSRNRLQYISESARSQFDFIATYSSNLTIDLSNNELKCTCETREFIKWLANTKVKLFNGKMYTCKLSNDVIQTLGKPIRIYETLQKNCTSYIPLIMTVVAFCILFITVLMSGLVYRNRWKLRYMYYMIKFKFNLKTTEQSTVEKLYTYDAFVSYEDSDREFVHEVLLQNLEKNMGLKLCIHKRDFLPGREIAENITSAIHDSRKVIVIMSHDYIKSYWCMFEFNMAKIESIYSRNKENILFLVFLHPLSTKELPLNILELVQTQSYIEFPRDEYGDTVFWEKLREVIS